AAKSDTSNGTASVLPTWLSSRLLTTPARRVSFWPLSATANPSFKSASATAKPMPRLAPVTNATLVADGAASEGTFADPLSPSLSSEPCMPEASMRRLYPLAIAGCHTRPPLLAAIPGSDTRLQYPPATLACHTWQQH